MDQRSTVERVMKDGQRILSAGNLKTMRTLAGPERVLIAVYDDGERLRLRTILNEADFNFAREWGEALVGFFAYPLRAFQASS